MHTYTENFSPQNGNWMSREKKTPPEKRSVAHDRIADCSVQFPSGCFDIFHSSVLAAKTLSLRWGEHMRFVADVMCHSPSNLK